MGRRVKKKGNFPLMVGGGSARTDFTRKNRKKRNVLKTLDLPHNYFNTIFFNCLVGGTLSSLDLGPKGGSIL